MKPRASARPDPTRKDWLEYRHVRDRRDEFLARRHADDPPEPFLVRADHFLRLCNEDLGLSGSQAISRRTLQFYSSPQAGLMPLPQYRDRHTAYYRFPEDYERLSVVWTLRSRFYLPIELVRSVLMQAPPHFYPLIMDWDESPQTLLDMIAMEKAGYGPEDFERYSAAKSLLGGEPRSLLVRDFSHTAAKKALLKKLDEEHSAAREWIESGRGIEFWTALIEARRARPEADGSAGKGGRHDG